MARTLDDLTYFTRAIIRMEPWKYEHTVHPIAWRSEIESEAQNKPLRVGLMTSDGMYHHLTLTMNVSHLQIPRRCPSNPGH
jgi:hypothetical protein